MYLTWFFKFILYAMFMYINTISNRIAKFVKLKKIKLIGLFEMNEWNGSNEKKSYYIVVWSNTLERWALMTKNAQPLKSSHLFTARNIISIKSSGDFKDPFNCKKRHHIVCSIFINIVQWEQHLKKKYLRKYHTCWYYFNYFIPPLATTVALLGSRNKLKNNA